MATKTSKTKKTAQEAMAEAELGVTEDDAPFDFSSYQISNSPIKQTVHIPETGDSFEVTVKQLSWSRRNQILAESILWGADGNTSFNSDAYMRSCLKEILVNAPWGRTTESFLISIDARLGAALEAIVPRAFSEDTSSSSTVDAIKKEPAHS